MLTGMVQMSERYIENGSAAFSPILNGTVGDVGVISASILLEGGIELPADDGAHALRLDVPGIVIAGG